MLQEDAIIAVFEAIADQIEARYEVSKGVTVGVDVTNIRTAINDLKATRVPITHYARGILNEAFCGEPLRTDVCDNVTMDIIEVTCLRCHRLVINRS